MALSLLHRPHQGQGSDRVHWSRELRLRHGQGMFVLKYLISSRRQYNRLPTAATILYLTGKSFKLSEEKKEMSQL